MSGAGRSPTDRGGSDRAAIEAEILAWMAAPDWRTDRQRFDALALALFRFQYGACPPYARYCDALDLRPDTVREADTIPAVPTGAFKEFALRCFPAEAICKTFRTSGTTTERRGTLHLDTLRLYEASLLASLRRCFLTDLCGRRPRMRFLAASPAAAPDSSLTHMFATLAAAEGHVESGFDFANDGLALDSLARALEAARREDAPVVVAGTSFAFVHLLDSTRADPPSAWALPAGSRVLETGGFKGRSREIPRERLQAELAARFSLPPGAIVNQYGMTELGSQFYDSTLVDPLGPRRKLAPPWTRVRFVDPDSGRDVPFGEVGMIVIHDLANTGSVAAIQTADLGRAIAARGAAMGGAMGGARSVESGDASTLDGFEVLGRAEGAEERGCSIAADTVLVAVGTRGRP